MAAPENISSGVGFRNLRIFELKSTGFINATSPTAAYVGLLLSGVRNLEINDPEPRLFTHLGDDAPFALDSLPPTEPVTGTLIVSKQNDPVDALLGKLKAFQVGELNLFGVGTNQRGFEPQVGAIAYRHAVVTDPDSANFGLGYWQFKIMPRVVIIPLEGNFTDTPEERRYIVRPGFVTKHIWGTAFALGTEGFTRSQILRGTCLYRPRYAGWLGNGAQTLFTLPDSASEPAASTAKVLTWVNGVLQTSGITTTVTSVTFTVAPANNAEVNIFWEVV